MREKKRRRIDYRFYRKEEDASKILEIEGKNTVKLTWRIIVDNCDSNSDKSRTLVFDGYRVFTRKSVFFYFFKHAKTAKNRKFKLAEEEEEEKIYLIAHNCMPDGLVG